MPTNDVEKMLAGHLASGIHKWKQITGTAEIAEPVYAFIPVNGDATFSTIEVNGQSISTDNGVAAGTYYQNVYYPGSYSKLVLATGTIVCYLGKQ